METVITRTGWTYAQYCATPMGVVDDLLLAMSRRAAEEARRWRGE